MKVLVGVSCHRLEKPHLATHTVSQWLAHGFDVIVVFDRIPDWADQIKVEKTAVGPGVGVSRDYILKTAVERGYDYVITSDCHLPEVRIRRVEHGVPMEKFGLFKFVGWIHKYHDIDRLMQVNSAPYVPTSSQPVIIFETRLVKRLIDIQKGYAVLTPGWGFELNDPTLSISVAMQRWLKVLNDSYFTHIHRSGKEQEWTERWKEPEQQEMYIANRCIYTIKFGFQKKPIACPERYRDRYEIAKEFYDTYGRYTVEVFKTYDALVRRLVIWSGLTLS